VATPSGASSTSSPSSLASVPQYLWSYANDHAELAKAADDLRRFLAELASGASIDVHTIESRAKTLRSYSEKSEKKLSDGSPKYRHPEAEIQDCVAARVIVFTTRAREDLAGVIERRTVVGDRENPGKSKNNGYDSEHFIITGIRDEEAQARYGSLSDYLDKYPGLEVQLRSVAGHAWAEYEHDIRYKSRAYDLLSEAEKRRVNQWFVEAGGMRHYMDDLFDRIQNLIFPLAEVRASLEPADGSEEVGVVGELEEEFADEPQVEPVVGGPVGVITLETMQRFVASRYPKSEVGEVANLVEVLGHLQQIGVNEFTHLEAVLVDVESSEVERLMDYPVEPTGIRRLDDELLASLAREYADSAPGEDRAQLLHLRLRRLLGRFAIYSIDAGEGPSRLMAAARAVRQLAKLVAERAGLGAAVVGGAVVLEPGALNPSAHPRAVRAAGGVLFVATNLTRAGAEDIMRSLLENAPGANLRVARAGDLLFETGE